MQHFDHALLDDPVNLASRLEGRGKVYGIDLVIDADADAYRKEHSLGRVLLPKAVELDELSPHRLSRLHRIFDNDRDRRAGHSRMP